MNFKQFCDKWIGKRYKEVGMKNYECVALCKLYYQEVYKITGLFFG